MSTTLMIDLTVIIKNISFTRNGPVKSDAIESESNESYSPGGRKIIMLFMILNLALSVIIMYFIGWQIHQKAFPFRSWRDGGPKTGWDWINLLFIIYNLYAITTTWTSLGIFTLYGVLYLLVMLVALFAGIEGPAMKDFVNQAKTYGFKSAVDQWRRMHRR